MKCLFPVALGVALVFAGTSTAIVHNEEYIPEPYSSYAEILIEATVELEGGDSFTGTLALYDRAIMVESNSFTRVAYVPIEAGTIVEKTGKNVTKITTAGGKVYEGRASTRNGSIVLICKRIEPAVDTRMIMNLQAKYNYISGISKIERIEVHTVLEDRYVENYAPELAGPRPGDVDYDELDESAGEGDLTTGD